MNEKIDLTGIDEISQPIAAEPVAEVLSPDDLNQVNKAIELDKKYGDVPLKAAALGAARGLSFGVSDQALVKSGLSTQEELSEIKERNKIASLTGEVGATIASAFVSSTPVAAVSKAGLAAEKFAEKAFMNALASEGKKSIAKEIVKKSIPKALGSAVEGAAYGAGQLVSEDALGDSTLTAENLLASAGTGALLGAVAGGIFEAPKALIPIKDKATSVVKSKIGDPTDAALDLFGVSATQRAKLKSQNKQFVDDLPAWTVEKANLGLFTDNESLKNNIIKVRKEAGEKIGTLMKSMDDAALTNPTLLPTNREVYSSIAKNMSDDILDKYSSIPGFKEQIRPVKSIRNDFIKLAQKEGQVNASELHKLRMKVDELIKFDKAPGTFTLKEKALSDVRFMLNDEINNIAKKASALDTQGQLSSILPELLQANKDFSYASRLIPNIEKKVEKEAAKKGIFNLTDIMTGAAGASIDPTLGLGTVVVKKLMEADVRRRIVLLANMEKQNRAINARISSNVKGFFENIQKPAKTILRTTILKSSISTDENGKKPKDKKEAFKNIQSNINKLSSDPEALSNMLSKRTMHVEKIAPNITEKVTENTLRGLQFLQTKLPKQTVDMDSAKLFSKREFSPSDFQMAKFERYLEVVENPVSALEDLKEGSLTREAAETLKVVYPNLFKKMQSGVLDNLEKNKEVIPYSKRIQLGILLDVPTDVSLKPEYVAALQANLGIQEQQPKSTPTKAENITIAKRTETEANKIAQRSV